jgi:RimJ/RimL family protein N-acetyltransferase
MPGEAPILTDGVITLRAFRDEDAEAHLAGEDEAMARWLSGGVSTIQSVRRWIERNQRHWARRGPICAFAILAPGGKLVGMIEANSAWGEIDGLIPGDANIAYGLYPAGRGNGYATRAVALICDFLKTREVKRAVIRVAPDNAASLAVPRRAGFGQTQTIRTWNGVELVVFVKPL